MTTVGGVWKSLATTRSELNLRITLLCGQSFRWREVGTQTWAGVINNSIITLKQEDSGEDRVQYQFFTPVTLTPPTPDSEERILKDYFQLSHSLASLYPVWGATGHSINDQFKVSAAGMTGVRILRQPPLECLYSFICSSNNNISRITKMVESLCSTYGTYLGEVGGHKFYSFPTLQQLEGVDEATLRDLGFGYIVRTTEQLKENEKTKVGWLEALRSSSRQDTQTNLITLTGVGRKVADCVALFSLDKLEVVPIDTHIFSLAQRHMPSLKGKSLTPALYEVIGDFFREKFGTLAGWAHTILFAGDLAKFQADVANANKKQSKGENDETDKENTANEIMNEKGKRKPGKKAGGRKTKKSKNR